MTDVMTSRGQGQEPAELPAADEQLLRELTERARAGGLQLTGEGGLLGKLTRMVIEGALEGELDDHLGYGKHDAAGRVARPGVDPQGCARLAGDGGQRLIQLAHRPGRLRIHDVVSRPRG